MAAEVAATAEKKVKYAQALLDLVKAFDRIPQWLLVREAIAIGYPFKLLRLSIAVYKLNRVIRIGGLCPTPLWPSGASLLDLALPLRRCD